MNWFNHNQTFKTCSDNLPRVDGNDDSDQCLSVTWRRRTGQFAVCCGANLLHRSVNIMRRAPSSRSPLATVAYLVSLPFRVTFSLLALSVVVLVLVGYFLFSVI